MLSQQIVGCFDPLPVHLSDQYRTNVHVPSELAAVLASRS
jgi:hypothetical protein